jgi:transcriptional regulator with PAS, ATPase and Fis domain
MLIRRGNGSLKFYFIGFKRLESVKKALRNYDIVDLKDRKSLESISLSDITGNFFFINTSSDTDLQRNEIENILNDLKRNVGIFLIIVGEDVNSISQKRKGTLFIEVKENQEPDKEVARILQKIRNTLNQFAGNSAYTRNLKREVISFAFFDPNVLILGETGAGKTLLASIIHDVVLKRKNLVFLNATTIPSSLIESELFGHAKGSYTSAVSTKEGLIAKADGGHMFFDEIAELPLHIQAKLLHVVEDGTYNMVGDPTVRKVDVRFISATNRDTKYLRRDLFFRMAERVVRIPPLRQRKDDIPEITNFIFESNGYNFRFEDMPPESQDELLNYTYPGNIRELQNIVKKYISEGKITIPTMPVKTDKSKIAFSKTSKISPGVKAAVVDNILNVTETIIENGEIPPYPLLKKCIDDQFSIVYLTRVLQMFKWNKHEVAEKLDISYRYLGKLIHEYGLDRRNTKKDSDN